MKKELLNETIEELQNLCHRTECPAAERENCWINAAIECVMKEANR